MNAGDPNSDRHACAVNGTATAASPQPQHALLKLNDALLTHHFMAIHSAFYIASALC